MSQGAPFSETAEEAALLQRWRALAAAFVRHGQSAEAGAALRRVLALLPSDPNCRFQLALEAERRGDAERARMFYGRGLIADPDSIDALQRLAGLRFAAGQGESAISLLLRA